MWHEVFWCVFWYNGPPLRSFHIPEITTFLLTWYFSSPPAVQELMSQRQKLAVEREKLQAELEHFRKCLTLPQTHWPRSSHYKGYPPRWPHHADQMAPGPLDASQFWLTLRVYFSWPGPQGLHQGEHGWLVKKNEWNDGWWADGWMNGSCRTMWWRTESPWIAASRGLCHEPLTRANVANPHPRSATVWGGKITWRSTQTHSRTCFSASPVPAALLFAPCIPRRHSYTDNPANEGAVAPRGAWSKTLECSKGSWPVGTVFVLCFVLFLFFFCFSYSGHELLNWKCT